MPNHSLKKRLMGRMNCRDDPIRFQLSNTMRKITDIPDIDKPREKLIRRDVSTLSNVELLAVLIGRGVWGRDVLQVASEVDMRFKDDLDRVGFEELVEKWYRGGEGIADS